MSRKAFSLKKHVFPLFWESCKKNYLRSKNESRKGLTHKALQFKMKQDKEKQYKERKRKKNKNVKTLRGDVKPYSDAMELKLVM